MMFILIVKWGVKFSVAMTLKLSIHVVKLFRCALLRVLLLLRHYSGDHPLLHDTSLLRGIFIAFRNR